MMIIHRQVQEIFELDRFEFTSQLWDLVAVCWVKTIRQ